MAEGSAMAPWQKDAAQHQRQNSSARHVGWCAYFFIITFFIFFIKKGSALNRGRKVLLNANANDKIQVRVASIDAPTFLTFFLFFL